MDKQFAMQILQEALDIAIQKGCYNLINVTNIVKAIEFLKQDSE